MRKYLLLKSKLILRHAWFSLNSSQIPYRLLLQFLQSSSSSGVFDEHAVTAFASPPFSKKSKLLDFINPHLRGNNTTIDKLSHADVKQQYAAFIAVADEEMYGRGLYIFNEKQFNAVRRLRPLARQILTAPASSAASERVFNMRPARSRLSRANVSRLLFEKL